jgi:hypothetical protein
MLPNRRKRRLWYRDKQSFRVSHSNTEKSRDTRQAFNSWSQVKIGERNMLPLAKYPISLVCNSYIKGVELPKAIKIPPREKVICPKFIQNLQIVMYL